MHSLSTENIKKEQGFEKININLTENKSWREKVLLVVIYLFHMSHE